MGFVMMKIERAKHRIIAAMLLLVLIATYFTALILLIVSNAFIKNRIINLIQSVTNTSNKNYINFSTEDVYISDKQRGGYVIDFNIKDRPGYMIVFQDHSELIPIETKYDKRSPYYGKPGKNYYPSLGQYIKKIHNTYIDMSNNSVLNISLLHNEFYASSDSDEKKNIPVTKTIEYKSGYVVEEYEISINSQKFNVNYDTGLTNAKNNCANAAGVIALNYWNQRTRNQLLKLNINNLIGGRIYDANNLIADGSFNNSIAVDYMNLFYDYMRTNTIFGTGGTLPNNLYSGFERVITEHGYQAIKTTDMYKWSDITAKINTGTPIFVTSLDYYFADSIPSSVEILTDNCPYAFTVNYKRTYSIAKSHSFVAYGYKAYSLRTMDDQTLYLRFLKVADGWGSYKYYNFDYGDHYSVAAIRVLPKNQ